MPTILVIDDELALRVMLEELLTDEGYQVVALGSGREALARLDEVRPDLLLCDVMLPGLDGREVYRAVQADPRWQALPVVLMSAGYQRLGRADAPPAAFVRKPFLVQDLLATLTQVLGGPPGAGHTPPTVSAPGAG